MKRTALWAYWIMTALLLTVVSIMLLQGKRQLDADIIATLPDFDQPQINAADKYFSAQLAGKMLLSFAGEQADEAIDTAAQTISTLPGIDVQAMPLSQLTDIIRFYEPYKGNLLSPPLAEALGSPEAIINYAGHYLGQTASPFVGASINTDPSMNTAGFIEHNLANVTRLSLQGDRLSLHDPNTGTARLFLFLTTGGSAGADGLNTLQQHIVKWQADYPDTDIRYSGAPFHNQQNTQLAKHESTVFSLISLLGLALLVWLAFRSVWPLLLTQLAVLTAVIWGVGGLVLLFSHIHVLSFVFGITLVGIAIDYTFHVLAHQHGRDGSLGKTITLGFITTALGYLAFLLSPMLVLSQVATFVIAGLTGAWLFAVLPLPAITARLRITPEAIATKTCAAVSRYANAISRLKVRGLLAASALSLMLWLLYPLTLTHDVRSLSGSSPALQANEQYHYGLLNEGEQRFFVQADTLQALLEREEAAAALITTIAPDANVQRLSQWLPSLALQQQNYQQLKTAVAEQQFAYLDALLQTPVEFNTFTPLTLEAFSVSPLAEFAALHLFEGESGWVSWISLTHVSAAQLAAITEATNGLLSRYSKIDMLNTSMAHFSHQVVLLSMLAIGAVVLIIGIAEGISVAFSGAVIITNAIAMALWISATLLGELNVFNLLALLLLIALAADYVIFYARQGLNTDNILAISLSALSSLLVFGVLSASDTPALQSCGTTVAAGIVMIYLMTPLTKRTTV